MNKIVVVALFSVVCMSALYRPEAANAGITSDQAAAKTVVRPGREIRAVNRDGYTLTYHLLDLSERGKMIKMMGHHSVIGLHKSPDVTNHLMVYIGKPGGKTLRGDVAYMLTGPDGKEFRTMTMGMYGGYGADVIMKLKGAYTIRTKIALEDGDALDDEFTFRVK